MLREITANDPAFKALIGSAHQRFQRLVTEAEAQARPYYQRIFGRELGITQVIEEIFDSVERDGDAAVTKYNALFDEVNLTADQLRIATTELEAAWNSCDNTLREAMRTAIAQVEAYQRKLLPTGFGEKLDMSLGVRWLPLQRVGAYVPGGPQGTLPLFSSVIMNLVPAKVAGVPELVLMTPARKDGSVAKELLAAAHAVGVREVYRVGGIPAIAALACGTPSIRAVDKIVGPGNIFVTLAKKFAFGRVDIDMLAGPSEILIIADAKANPAFVAADLLSQAEHDVLAMAICLLVGDQKPEAIQRELTARLGALPRSRQNVARESLERFGCLVRCRDLDEAIDIANRIAPEHVEILIADPAKAVPRLTNAGAVFVGPWSPEPIGDYVAGPSHTLPTGGTARMWSGIGADTFLRRSSIINLNEADFRRLAQAGMTMAQGEGLEAHARSIAVRLQ
jgi:histidinol dehydrogenase